MEQIKREPLTKEEQKQRRKERWNKFLGLFRFTKDGKAKSALMTYSVSLGLGLLVLHVLCYLVLIDAMEQWLSAASPVLRDLAEWVVPTLLLSAVGVLLFFTLRDKRLVPCAYAWDWVFALILLIGVWIAIPASDVGLFLLLYLKVAAAPLILGSAVVFTLYFRDQSQKRRLQEQAERPDWDKQRGN